MGLMKKKKENVKSESAAVVELSLAMHGSTTLNADDESESCFALFQTDKPLSPAEWVSLAQAARVGYKFLLVVIKNDEKKE